VGQKVTAAVRVRGWLGIVASLPVRRKIPLLIAFRMGTTKAEIYWISQPELRKDEVVKSS
jgi:hypothetical protein